MLSEGSKTSGFFSADEVSNHGEADRALIEVFSMLILHLVLNNPVKESRLSTDKQVDFHSLNMYLNLH